MVEKPEVKPINWVDQGAHFGSCFFLTLLSLGFGAPIVVLWAITREYYQVKQNMIDAARQHELPKVKFKQVIEFMKYDKTFTNRDLKFSYWGVAVGIACAIPIDIWLF